MINSLNGNWVGFFFFWGGGGGGNAKASINFNRKNLLIVWQYMRLVELQHGNIIMHYLP